MFVKLTKEQHQKMLDDIQYFFSNERDEEITEFAAERVLEFMKEAIGPQFYNAALKDAQVLVEQRMLAIEEDLSALERPVSR